MKLEVYSIYDKARMEFGPPFYSPKREVALREFKIYQSNVPDVAKQDMQLHYLGIWDTEDAWFTCDEPQAVDIIKEELEV
jgi:hypothetical protein